MHIPMALSRVSSPSQLRNLVLTSLSLNVRSTVAVVTGITNAIAATFERLGILLRVCH